MDFVVQTQTASLAINGSPGASRLVLVSWPVSVVCLANSKLRTGRCRGVRVDGGHGQHGERDACHGGPQMSPPLVFRGMPGTDRRETTAFRTGRLLGNRG
jgi:hypothetical protein